MSPIEHIRKIVFEANQSEFAEIAGTTQPSISRWERGEQEPSYTELTRIRQAAKNRGLVWNDSWFWVVPVARGQKAPA